MSGYGDFAAFYDILNADARYDERGEYLWSIFERFKNPPKSCLDLACGTGVLTECFAKKGCEMIGVDGSYDMLEIARERLCGSFPDTLLLCQDMTELDLYGTVKGGICTLDSINHLCEAEEVSRLFSRLKFFIEPGGLFVFDVNTPYKHKEVLGDNCFVVESEGIYCGWQNFLDKDTLRVDIALDIFAERGGHYERYSEEFSERAYTKEQLCGIVEQNGFTVEAIYGDMTFEPPAFDEQRYIFVIKRKGM